MKSIKARAARQLGRISSACTLELLESRRMLSAKAGAGISVTREVELPRYLTAAEREYLKKNPLGGATVAVPTSPPTGPIDPVAEYEPMEGLVISWAAHTGILTEMTKRVTDAGGRMYINVASASVQTNATNALQSAGVNMANVTFRQYQYNSVWIRDYGPRYVYEDDVRVITDHEYNRPRPLDNVQPNDFAALKQHKYYEIGLNGTTLIHGGGNYHLNATGDAYATQLIDNENSFNIQQIQQIWLNYENNNTTITGAFPTSVDATQHIDMWMQIYDDNKVFIGNFDNPSGNVALADAAADATASLMQSRGYQVTRLPNFSIGGTHYTFTNMVIFNDIVLLPFYNGGPGSTVSNQVLATVQAAMPGKTIFQITADSIVPQAGVFHCIEQHIPVHQGLAGVNGGLAPTAYVRGPNNGETLQAGQAYQIEWISDDDAPVAASGGVTGVDILLSTDGGQSFPTTIATNRPALGSHLWTVPAGINTNQARIRVVARDGVNNTGFDQSDINFTIIDPAVPAIMGSNFAFLTSPHSLAFQFNSNVSASLGTDDILLENLTTSQTIPAGDLGLSYNGGTNTATFSYTPGILPDGNYRATLIAAGITNGGGTPLPANHIFNFFFLQGDANRDARVNLADYNIVTANYGQSPRNFMQGDFNYDNQVNLADYNILAGRYGTQLGSDGLAGGFSQRLIGRGGASDDTDDVLSLMLS